MQESTYLHPLPSYAEVLNPENADIYPVLSHALTLCFLPSDSAMALHRHRPGCKGVPWQFQSDCGAFKNFSIEVSCMLEAARVNGLLTYEIPERHWFFNLKLMTQTSSLVKSTSFSPFFSTPADCPCSCFGKEAFGDAVTLSKLFIVDYTKKLL